MHQETTIINAEELFGNFSNPNEFQNMEDGFEKYWEWPEEIGKGFVREIDIRPGLKLMIRDFQPRENLVEKVEVENSPLGIGFCLSGNIQNTVSQGKTQKQRIVSKRGKEKLKNRELFQNEGKVMCLFPQSHWLQSNIWQCSLCSQSVFLLINRY
jgi:hypothetical protein